MSRTGVPSTISIPLTKIVAPENDDTNAVENATHNAFGANQTKKRFNTKWKIDMLYLVLE